MKVKSSVLFGLIVLTCLAGGISLIYRLTKEAEVWNPSEMYKTSLSTSKGTKCTTVSYASGSTSDAPLVRLGAGSMSRARVPLTHAPVGISSAYTQYPIAGTSSYSQSPIANSQGLYTTSSAELRSFGGGGNGGGVSMSGGSVHSSGSAVSAPSMGLSATMPNGSLFTFAGQNTNANIPIVSGDAAIAAVASASSYGTAYSGIGYTTGGASRGISGRKNGAVEDSWLQWLAKYGTGHGSKSGDENGWTYTFNYSQLNDAYQDYVTNYWDDMWGEPPTFDQWLLWFQGNDGSHSYRGNTYTWAPIGDYYPLLILAMLYVGYVAIRRRKSKISENNI